MISSITVSSALWSVTLLSVAFFNCSALGYYAEGRYAESHGACLRIPLLGAVKRSAIAAYSSPSS